METTWTFGKCYPGLFLGTWQGKRPEDFGLLPDDWKTPVCSLCLWHGCDRCSIAADEVDVDGPPPIELVLDGLDYASLPASEHRREDEEDDQVERHGEALYFARENQVIFPRSWAVLDEELDEHPAFRIRDEEDKMEKRTLVLYCDGGRRSDGSTYGSVRLGCTGQIIRREFGPGTSNEAEYKALCNALWAARQVVRRPALKFNSVEIRMDSDLVRNQVLGTYRVNNPRLEELKARVWEEINKLMKALHQVNDPKECTSVRLVRADRQEVKRVLGH